MRGHYDTIAVLRIARKLESVGVCKALCASAALAAQATPPEETKPAEGLAFIEPSHPTASTEHTVSNMFEAETTSPMPDPPTDGTTGPTCHCYGTCPLDIGQLPLG